MFDLAFFKTVHSILQWKEAPPLVFTNEHEETVRMRKNQSTLDHSRTKTKTTGLADKLLHIYISVSYPLYFGFELRTSTVHHFVDKCHND